MITELCSRCNSAERSEIEGKEIICCKNKQVKNPITPLLALSADSSIKEKNLCYATSIWCNPSNQIGFPSPNVRIDLCKINNCSYSNTYCSIRK